MITLFNPVVSSSRIPARRQRLTTMTQTLAMAWALVFGAVPAHADITLDVLYTQPGTFGELQQELSERFSELHPDIKIKFREPPVYYEETAQQILADHLKGHLPDVAFNGINQLGLLVNHGGAVALDSYIAKDGGQAKLGYYPTLLKLGKWNNKTYGIPFATSTPILYVNEDLLAKAKQRVEALPRTWPELIAVGKKVEAAAGPDTLGLYFQWEQTGNWLVQALVDSKGGRMLKADGCSIAFDDSAGQWALKTLESFGKSGMPYMTFPQARQAFIAGRVGVLADSTSYLTMFTRQIGERFKFKTLRFPLPAANGRLPAGGTMAMVFATNAKHQQAAWEYVKFVTGPVGQSLMAKLTGYMPVNEVAVTSPALLGDFYAKNPNYLTSMAQLPLLMEWASFPGDNSLKIIETIRAHVESLVRGGRSAEDVMPNLVRDVAALKPPCSGR